MKKLSRYLPLLTLCVELLSSTDSIAQGGYLDVVLTMSNNVTQPVKLKDYTDEFLVTAYGVVKLKKVVQVAFMERDRQAADFFLDKLSKEGIIVFIGDEKINPSIPAKAVTAGTPNPSSPDFKPRGFTFGLGIGLDYGGFGTRLTAYPDKQLGIFLGLGYALAGVGVNGGLNLRLTNQPAHVCGVLTGMYGYNAAIVLEGYNNGNSYSNSLYYGLSLGGGFELHSRKNWNQFFDFKLLIPFRSDSFDKDYSYIKAYVARDITSPWPVQISVGYNF